MADLRIDSTPGKGLGVFTNQPITKGEFIIEFTGKLFAESALPSPYGEHADHYVQVGPTLYMGPSGEFDDYINHSCVPTCGLREVGGKILCYAIRDIPEGHELSWDYSTMQDNGWWTMQCQCGEEECRHWIGDFKYLPIRIQKRYLFLGIVPDFIAAQYQIDAPAFNCTHTLAYT